MNKEDFRTLQVIMAKLILNAKSFEELDKNLEMILQILGDNKNKGGKTT